MDLGLLEKYKNMPKYEKNIPLNLLVLLQASVINSVTTIQNILQAKTV
jgi:hypothetical protein